MGGKIRVLIVDDDVDFCFICREQMNIFLDIVCCGMAYDGHDAVKKIHALLPDVVLLDQIMPGLDGLGVLEQIQAQPPDKMPRFLACSVSGQELITRELMQRGADYFLEKPFDAAILARRIRFVHALPNEEFTYCGGYLRTEHSDRLAEESCAPFDRAVAQFVIALGVPTELIGHDYIQNALCMIGKRSARRPTLRQIYGNIAKLHDTDSRCVENAINTAIKTTMAHRTPAMEKMLGLLPNTSAVSLSNGKFLTLSAQSLRMLTL